HLVAVTNGITPLGSNLFVDANHLFTTTNGTYTFTLQDATESCQGCVISARVLVDGIVYATNSGANALLGGVVTPFSPVNFSVLLGAVVHPLSLELFKTLAINGAFKVYFDDVSIAGPTVSATPPPAGLPLFATGLGALGLLGWRRKRKGAAEAAI